MGFPNISQEEARRCRPRLSGIRNGWHGMIQQNGKWDDNCFCDWKNINTWYSHLLCAFAPLCFCLPACVFQWWLFVWRGHAEVERASGKETEREREFGREVEFSRMLSTSCLCDLVPLLMSDCWFWQSLSTEKHKDLSLSLTQREK